jgi:hypothetical protein
VKKLIEAACFFFGVAAISTGLWWILPAAGLMFAGLVFILIAFALARTDESR